MENHYSSILISSKEFTKMKQTVIAFIGIWIIGLLSDPTVLAQGSAELKYQPEEIGKSVVSHIVKQRVKWRYQRVCAYYGACKLSESIDDPGILQQMEALYAPFLESKKSPHSGHVDYNVFGIWPFEMYRQTANEQYLKQARELADNEFMNPREDGLSEYTRFWVDDMYMVGSLQVQAYKSTLNKVYLDRAALTLKVYCDSLQKENGLFYHREDVPFYWGRGNGWAAAALTEVLMVLPEDHENYQSLLDSYKKMMASLKSFQGADGMWHQLLDNPDSFPETSCTGMFLFAMASGMNKDLLPESEYKTTVVNAWNALASYVNNKGQTRNVCIGTNAKNSEWHYLKRLRKTGDFHGQAAVLWASSAMAELIKP
jgi:unsaturated rhamnogalacturonyl hydrolase